MECTPPGAVPWRQRRNPFFEMLYNSLIYNVCFYVAEKGFCLLTLRSCLNNNKIALFSSSSLPYRQLRNSAGSLALHLPCSLPYRQLRNSATFVSARVLGSLPYRQLRKWCATYNVDHGRSLPYRQLRNYRLVWDNFQKCSLPYRQLRKGERHSHCSDAEFTAVQAA